MIKAINKYGNYFFLFSSKLSLEKIRTLPHSFLCMILLISLISPVQSTPTCNSFPKIYGGSSDNTYLRHIDAFNDYLALAGETYDNSLIGIITSSFIPYIALASI
jgi:hypothetical protein